MLPRAYIPGVVFFFRIYKKVHFFINVKIISYYLNKIIKRNNNLNISVFNILIPTFLKTDFNWIPTFNWVLKFNFPLYNLNNDLTNSPNGISDFERLTERILLIHFTLFNNSNAI